MRRRRAAAAPLEQGAAFRDDPLEEQPMANPAPGYAKKPEHRVDLLSESRRVRATFAGCVIADTREGVRCEETGHGPVVYLAAEDVRMDLLGPTAHKTY